MAHQPLSTNLVISADGTTRTARAAVRDLGVSAQLDEETIKVAELLVSELVTNAHEHGGGTAVLDAALDAGCLRVAVADDAAALPQMRNGDVEDERGRGLLLVDGLASRWGADPCGVGKTVWFELNAS